MNTKQLNFDKRAMVWWDKLSITQKVWYGQMYAEHTNKTQLIFQAYSDYIENAGHLKVIE